MHDTRSSRFLLFFVRACHVAAETLNKAEQEERQYLVHIQDVEANNGVQAPNTSVVSDVFLLETTRYLCQLLPFSALYKSWLNSTSHGQ